MKASDKRPESYKVDIDSIVPNSPPLSAANYWQARKEVILPLLAPSLCHLRRLRDETGAPTLGLIKPRKITSFEIVPEGKPYWTPKEKEKLLQYDLFNRRPHEVLEKIPYKFYYKFCCDDPHCIGHRLSCYDWEMGAAYRKWRDQYGDDWEAKFRGKFEHEMIDLNDTYFFVGTIKAHPNTWIIVGLFYPRRDPSGAAQMRPRQLPLV